MPGSPFQWRGTPHRETFTRTSILFCLSITLLFFPFLLTRSPLIVCFLTNVAISAIVLCTPPFFLFYPNHPSPLPPLLCPFFSFFFLNKTPPTEFSPFPLRGPLLI